MKILFISRAYPPIVGGIENQNWELGTWLGKIADITIIANKKGKKFLPFFLPFAVIKSLFIARKFDAILLGDGVLGIVGWKLKLFCKKPVICVVHGLDLTYKNKLYQSLWVRIFIKSLDKLIAVGNETARIAKEKGIPENKIVFIPNGVDANKFIEEHRHSELEKIVGESIENKKIIVTSGRLAKRKGVAWFVRNVMPELPPNVIYVIVGDGPDKENIQRAISEKNLASHVKMLGYVSDETRNILFNTSDLFVQPNIKVPGDMEGFGLSVIEAAVCKIPVVASRLEGLVDAIRDGENGFLVESENSEAWIAKINELLENDTFREEFGEKAQKYVLENYRWNAIAQKYLEEIKKTIHV